MAATAHDGLNWRAHALVKKYSPDQAFYAERKWASRSFSTKVASRLRGGPQKVEGLFLSLLCGEPEDGYAEAAGNLLVTVGLNRITNLIIGGGGVALANASTLTGTGDTSTAATVGDTKLGSDSSTHSYYQPADSTYPSQSNGVITNQGTFASPNGNYAWAEWGWVIATTPVGSSTFAATGTSPVLVNHKISALGTKVSGASWVFQTTVTLS